MDVHKDDHGEEVFGTKPAMSDLLMERMMIDGATKTTVLHKSVWMHFVITLVD